MNRGRRKRAFFRCGVILLVALLAALVTSFVRHVDIFFGEWHAGILAGEAHLVHDKSTSAGLWPISCSCERVTSIDWAGLWLPRWTNNSRYQIEIMPLWIPLILIAVPTALLQFALRRSNARKPCSNCRYDLTGNISGVCPECGHAIERRHETSAPQA